MPASAWRHINLKNVTRLYRTPRILDRQITLSDYEGLLRQLTITELGHEEPSLLMTNHRTQSPARLIGRYAQRMLIENQIEDGVDFFHLDALSSAVALKVNCDLLLTRMASSLYRLLAGRWATATRRPSRVAYFGTLSTPPQRSQSRVKRFRCVSRGGRIIPCY